MINREIFTKLIKERAKLHKIKVNVYQINRLIDEMEDTMKTTFHHFKTLPDENKFIGAFSAGALFGSSNFKRLKMPLIAKLQPMPSTQSDWDEDGVDKGVRHEPNK